MLKKVILLILFFSSIGIHAQNVPLGTWTIHHTWSSAIGVAKSNSKIYGAVTSAVFSVNIPDGAVSLMTKANGLSDIGIAAIGFDSVSNTLIIVYTNSNIDLVKGTNVINLPDIKNKSIIGDKSIYQVFTYNGIAYLSCGFGIVKLDLEKEEISDTYYVTVGGLANRVNAVYADGNAIYAATEKGVLRGEIAPGINLANYNEWQYFGLPDGLPQEESSAINTLNGNIFASIDDVIYEYDGTDWTSFYDQPGWETQYIQNDENRLIFSQWKYSGNDVIDKRIGIYSAGSFSFLPADFYVERPTQIVVDKNKEIWYADFFRGLMKYNGTNYYAYIPNGPGREMEKGMTYFDGSIWVASSNVDENWNPAFSSPAFYKCTDFYWENYDDGSIPDISGYYDIATVIGIPAEDKLLLGSSGNGLIEFDPDTKEVQTFNKPPGSNGNYKATAMDMDGSGNIWISNAYNNVPLVCRQPGGNYLSFSNSILNNKLLLDVLTDNSNQVWIAIKNGGLAVYNYNGTLEETSDDEAITFTSIPGFGGLPTNAVNCITEDLDNEIWVGTEEGIALIRCPYAAFDRQCDAERICVPRGDTSNFCDILLEDEIVNCITIDAANRKWIGTNNGVFLLSADGLKTIHYFNEDNSPLIANKIRSIAIDGKTGEVFIGTTKGVVSYRGEATQNIAGQEEVYVYPNPVQPDYNGPIAIKGVPENAQVKITDIAGNLVYETQSLGGQAIWDGLLLNGTRAASGVYLVLSAGSSKKDKVVTKFVLIH